MVSPLAIARLYFTSHIADDFILPVTCGLRSEDTVFTQQRSTFWKTAASFGILWQTTKDSKQ